MSYINISSDLFLGKAEISRLKLFLDDSGFRKLFLINSAKFGLIKNQIDNTFTNSLVTESIGLTISHNEITAINSVGNIVSKKTATSISLPAINTWYWVKIAHSYSKLEQGTWSISSDGSLTCTSLNGELTKILRGQPDYPVKISFPNSVNNTIEYEALEIIDDNNATLQGFFNSESNLQLSVVGTFTPGSTPLEEEKYPYNYDSCTLTFVQELTLNTAPSKVEGMEFYLARVRSNGSSLTIQDKRSEFYQTLSDFRLKDIITSTNKFIGVEKINFSPLKTPKDSNLIQVGWNIRSSNWSFNSNLNIVTFSSAQGGRIKLGDFSLINDNDFVGYRLYVEKGKYYRVRASSVTGSQLNLYLDNSDLDEFTNTTQELVLTPNAEEIILVFKTNPSDTEFLSEKTFVFPINIPYAKCNLIVYKETGTLYNLTYKYKNNLDYSPSLLPLTDSIGYYNENQFSALGVLNISPAPTRTIYTPHITNGYIELILHPDAYSVFQSRVDLGDLFGVQDFALNNSTPTVNYYVGINKQIQRNTQSSFTLSQNLFIILKKTKADNLTPINNGNNFTFVFKGGVTLGAFKIKIVQDYIDNVTFTLLKEIGEEELTLITRHSQGLNYSFVFDGTDWFLKDTNEVFTIAKQTSFSTIETSTSRNLIATLTPSNFLSGPLQITADVELQASNDGGTPNPFNVFLELFQGTTNQRAAKHVTQERDLVVAGGRYTAATLTAIIDYTAGETINFYSRNQTTLATQVALVGRLIANGSNLKRI
jgi:hypothetical protein